jgi:hypothetical protein
VNARASVVYVTAAILAVALVALFARRGGPYFAKPRTIYDHVQRDRHPTIDDILVCRAAAPLLPRGATVTVLKPSEKPNYDTTHIDTAAGLLPFQRLVAPADRTRADYVITIRGPFADPRYALISEFPEGKLYKRR